MKQLFRNTVVLTVLLVAVLNSNIIAQEKPIQLSLFTPVQMGWCEYDLRWICGMAE
jgi:hypothetical protein